VTFGWRRDRIKPPIIPNPRIIMPQVAGSGTALAETEKDPALFGEKESFTRPNTLVVLVKVSLLLVPRRKKLPPPAEKVPAKAPKLMPWPAGPKEPSAVSEPNGLKLA
jgi:hypothetical protein